MRGVSRSRTVGCKARGARPLSIYHPASPLFLSPLLYPRRSNCLTLLDFRSPRTSFPFSLFSRVGWSRPFFQRASPPPPPPPPPAAAAAWSRTSSLSSLSVSSRFYFVVLTLSFSLLRPRFAITISRAGFAPR